MKKSFCFFSHITVDTVSKLSLLITKHWVESVNATMRIDVHRTWGMRNKISTICLAPCQAEFKLKNSK